MVIAVQLPVEVIEIILSYYYETSAKSPSHYINSADQGYISGRALRSLLCLRLLGNAWNLAVAHYIFLGFDLELASMGLNLIGQRSNTFFVHGMHQLSRLSIGQLFYSNTTNAVSNYQGVRVCSHVYPYPSAVVHMPDLQAIVEMCQQSLISLRLRFVSTVGFTQDSITALGNLARLKVLIIIGNSSRNVMNDSDSVVAIINRLSSLESLSINFVLLANLDVQLGSLPNLKHLYFSCDQFNIRAVMNFCRFEGNKIKMLEYDPPTDNAEEAAPVVSALRNSLKVLLIDVIPTRLPHEILGYPFPQLRIVKSAYLNATRPHHDWLHWPFFRQVQVFITNHAESKENWKKILKTLKENPPAQIIALKHVILISTIGSESEDPELMAAFQACGINCHFRAEMDYNEILDSDAWAENQVAQT